ncbi:MAG TPA: hypothetical protein VD816_03960 [Ohtaekwangia sp.]|nr:hypothetical protein [Ohtaekwangia sp.]
MTIVLAQNFMTAIQNINERLFNHNRLHSVSVLVIIVLVLVKPAGAIVI